VIKKRRIHRNNPRKFEAARLFKETKKDRGKLEKEKNGQNGRKKGEREGVFHAVRAQHGSREKKNKEGGGQWGLECRYQTPDLNPGDARVYRQSVKEYINAVFAKKLASVETVQCRGKASQVWKEPTWVAKGLSEGNHGEQNVEHKPEGVKLKRGVNLRGWPVTLTLYRSQIAYVRTSNTKEDDRRKCCTEENRSCPFLGPIDF